MYLIFRRRLRNTLIIMFNRYFGWSIFSFGWIIFISLLVYVFTSYKSNSSVEDVHAGNSENVPNNADITQADEPLALTTLQNTVGLETSALSSPTLFQSTLITHAEKDIIMICIVNSANFYFALNVYESSLRRQYIKNYIFITTNSRVSAEMQKRQLNFFAFFNDDDKTPMNPLSKEYERQMVSYKRKIIAEALKVQLRPLVFDPTIHLFRNPLADMLYLVNQNDHDIIAYPGGILTFALFIPTKNTVEMHNYIENYKHLVPEDKDDDVISNYLQWMLRRKENPLRIHALDMMRYVSGEKYFILGESSLP